MKSIDPAKCFDFSPLSGHSLYGINLISAMRLSDKQEVLIKFDLYHKKIPLNRTRS